MERVLDRIPEGVLEQICDSLEKLARHHGRLLEIVRIERDALVQADLKAIESATLGKQSVLEIISREDLLRQVHLADLSQAMKRPMKELTLSVVIAATEADFPLLSNRLRAAQQALGLLAQRVSDQNRENQALVARSLQHIEQMKKNVLGEATGPSKTYTHRGTSGTQAQGARLISREA